MGLTITNLSIVNEGPRRVRAATATFDSSYATGGGETIAASDFGLQTIDHLFINQVGGYVIQYDGTNGKLIVYVDDYDLGADGPLIEAGAINLSTLAVSLLAIGI